MQSNKPTNSLFKSINDLGVVLLPRAFLKSLIILLKAYELEAVLDMLESDNTDGPPPIKPSASTNDYPIDPLSPTSN